MPYQKLWLYYIVQVNGSMQILCVAEYGTSSDDVLKPINFMLDKTYVCFACSLKSWLHLIIFCFLRTINLYVHLWKRDYLFAKQVVDLQHLMRNYHQFICQIVGNYVSSNQTVVYITDAMFYIQ